MRLRYVGPSRKTMGVSAPGGAVYQFTPGEPFEVSQEHGEAILTQYPMQFEQVKRIRKQEPEHGAVEHEHADPVGSVGTGDGDQSGALQ